MADLIYSRKADAQALSLSAIHRQASAAFADTPIDGVSKNYGHLKTIDLLPILDDYGYKPVQALQTNCRKADRMGHQNHLISFAHKTDLRKPSDGRPEIVIYNSSDRSSALNCFAGYYRGICSNGLVAGEGFKSKVYHSKKNVAGFEDQLRDMLQKLPEMLGLVGKMKETLIDGHTGLEIAERGAALRWGGWLDESLNSLQEDRELNRGSYYDHSTLDDLLSSKRPGEGDLVKRRASLWHIFNRVQEGLIRGRAEVKSVSKRNPEGGSRQAPGLTGVGKAVDVNRRFWDVAAEYA